MAKNLGPIVAARRTAIKQGLQLLLRRLSIGIYKRLYIVKPVQLNHVGNPANHPELCTRGIPSLRFSGDQRMLQFPGEVRKHRNGAAAIHTQSSIGPTACLLPSKRLFDRQSEA